MRIFSSGQAVIRSLVRFALILVCTAMPWAAAASADKVVVGSKRFTESYVLGELVKQSLLASGIKAEHRQGLGNTAIVEQALVSGAIDIYPEYTGTIARELLKRQGAEAVNPSLAELNRWLAPRGLKAAVPLGFNNTYALALREADAQRLGVDSLSALARLAPAEAAKLRWGLSHEFLVRADGWPALKQAYTLPFKPGTGLDHGLAYQALAKGQVDVIDVYSTDAQIARLKLRVLKDDRAFFPRYDAVLLMRASLDESGLAAALGGRIDEATMIALNAQVEVDGRSFADVARGFLAQQAARAAAVAPGTAAASAAAFATSGASSPISVVASPPSAVDRSFWARLNAPDLWPLVGQHLTLVLASVLMAVFTGVPLGIWAWRQPRIAGTLMAAVGVLQTLPSLALLAFLIAIVGRIGFVPALLALWLYALLPIVRNTHAGLLAVPGGLSQAGRALGLRSAQRLWSIELPLAGPTLVAGIKTAAVINVGTATVAAFIGAGGLGERIVSGLAINDTTQMMAGAVPAAVLALVVQASFSPLEKWLRRGQH